MQTEGWSSLSKGRGLCDNTINSLLLKREAMYPMLMAVLLLYVRNRFLTSYLLLLATLTESLRENHRLNHRFHSGNASTFVTFDSL